jgi:hypothetical protein
VGQIGEIEVDQAYIAIPAELPCLQAKAVAE